MVGVRTVEGRRAGGGGLVAWGEGAAILLLALTVRLVGLGHPPFVDELYHVLAARSLLADGTLEIGAGVPYDRARLFTYVVAGMFRVFGESLESARLPGVIAGALLVGLLFVWVRREADRGSAWIAGLLLCFYPYAIANSQILRFYSLHALLFWLSALGLYTLVLRPPAARQSMLIGAFSLACFVLAAHLQPLVAVGGLALGFWVAGAGGRRAARWIRVSRNRLIGAAAGLVLTAALAVVLGLPARLSQAWSLFNYADFWAAANRDNVRYYYDLIGGQLGPLWTAVPALFAVAAVRRPRPAVFAGVIFATVFVFHSLAAWKIERYIHSAMPALFAILGIGVATLVRLGYQACIQVARRAGATRVGLRMVRAAFGLVVIATTLAVFDAAGATRKTIGILTLSGPDRPPPYNNADWQGARSFLQQDLDEAEVVVASTDLKSLYFLERLDYELFAGHLHTGDGVRPEFSIHPRSGIPVIQTGAALRSIVACYATGLVVIERNAWRVEYAVPAEAADVIEAELSPVPIPDGLHVLAFRWRHAPDPGAGCPEVRSAGR